MDYQSLIAEILFFAMIMGVLLPYKRKLKNNPLIRGLLNDIGLMIFCSLIGLS